MKEKKKVLDTAQLAFLTADPGLVQSSVANHINNYKKKKKLEHGVPNQMDSRAVWSRYTSEAAKIKVEDLQTKIEEAEKNLQEQIVKSRFVSPREFQVEDFQSE